MARQHKQQYLVISALGQDRPGIVNELTEYVSDSGCNIVDSRMTVLGGEFAILMMVEGNWNAVAKMEGLLPTIEKRLRLTVMGKRTEAERSDGTTLPYTVEVVCLDHPGIVHQLAGFFSGHGINIHDLYTDSYRAAHTGSPMFSASMTINVPSDMHIARLREEFLDFCDELNLDAVLEPVKR